MFMPRPPRLVSSSTIALILTALSFISLIPYLAHATDADSIAHDDHNHLRIRDSPNHSGVSGTLELMQEEDSRSYEPNFAGLDRSILGRAPNIRYLQINTPANADIDKDDTHTWTVRFNPDARSLSYASLSHGERDKSGFHELLKRQDGWWMNLTLSVCNISNLGNDEPPALRLDITRSEMESLSDSYGNFATRFATHQGFGNTSLKVTSDLQLSVYVDRSSNFEGTYSYELTASTGVSYASLVVLDSDNDSTLLASKVDANFSSRPPGIPYGIVVFPNDLLLSNKLLLSRISNSTCVLKKLARANSSKSITGNFTTGMTNLSVGTKQLFHVTGLNPGTSYWAIENRPQGLTDSGFEVFKPINFTTKSNSNCAVIYNLSFCTDTAYAVPYNPSSNLSLSALASFYDIQAKLLYKNFTFSLQQIPCDTTSSAQYSLARNCSHCDSAYRSWLCAVTIPRCEDFSASDNWLQPRSVSQPFWNGTPPSGVSEHDLALGPSNQTRRVMNSSRNPLIDQIIKPGPWKEVLPCEDLCYELVRSCPAALGFACPTGQWLSYSYGTRQKGGCNDPRLRSNASGRGAGTNVLGALVAFGLILVLQLGGHC